MKVWIDDLRDPMIFLGHNDLHWLKTYDEGLQFIKEQEASIESIHLDNDLGDEQNREGKHLFNYIEELLNNGQLAQLQHISIHSDNSSAVNNMLAAKDVMLQRYSVVVERTSFSVKKPKI